MACLSKGMYLENPNFIQPEAVLASKVLHGGKVVGSHGKSTFVLGQGNLKDRWEANKNHERRSKYEWREHKNILWHF